MDNSNQRIDRLENQIAAMAYQMRQLISLFQRLNTSELSLKDQQIIADAAEVLKMIQFSKKGNR